jgi:preprotein translocase subunit SecA
LHIIGTERHESRRLDNQLRGRAGRQGDPGSSRFFLSLQDELMRVFAGEWVANVLSRLGMAPGEAIESGMVTRRIEAAQKKVEEHNFDIRKNLLEYDEVMDYQRKRVYGYRQEILNDANPRMRIWNMMMQQVDLAIKHFLDPLYGPWRFAKMAETQLSIGVTETDFDSCICEEADQATKDKSLANCSVTDFANCTFDEADRISREKALNAIQTLIQEMLDENLDEETDASEWNWQAMADRANKMWGLKLNERKLKEIGRENIPQFLYEEAEKTMRAADLSDGKRFYDDNWGFIALCEWFQRKFGVALDPTTFNHEMPAQRIRHMLVEEVRRLYHEKEALFSVTVAFAQFMNDKGEGGSIGRHYDRAGLYHWYRLQMGDAGGLTEDDFRNDSRAKLLERLSDVAKKAYPEKRHEQIDAKLQDVLAGAPVMTEGGAQLVSEWAKSELSLEVPAEQLTGASPGRARDLMWNAFDARYRPDMRRMERSLLLGQLDTAWKNHLLTMDHVRQGIGLVGYAQVDPKTEYKRVGMKEFDGMWEELGDKVTDSVFHVEQTEAFDETVWTIGRLVHEAAPQLQVPDDSIQAQQQAAIASSQQSDKKQEPIRNRMEKVGRNDPCPCGSGKKYKKCCGSPAFK